jgi:uncharacterized lipoprotein YddW (UPF0748 family)
MNGTPILLAAALSLATGQAFSKPVGYIPSNLRPPAPMREFRGAWVATVANIDWPSTNNLTTAQQKAELRAIMDRAVKLKLNAIIFQVRPACDALYASRIEPWSEYLTGRMGRPPKPFYDPLALAVQEAHRRGLELHAWLNPYRARYSQAKSPASPAHISRTHPDLVRRYGHYLWLDPGEKRAQDYVLSVIMDILRRYNIDGVHFDDYFYPYPERDTSGRVLDFPDEASWRRSGQRGKLSRADWRRQNIDSFIHRVYASIKAEKPWVKFGISPFGIWRPGHPPRIKGFDPYESLYADSRKWLAEGWVDYFSPQLYWPITSPGQSFPALLRWWAAQNVKGRHLWPGLNDYEVGRGWKAGEIVDQIRLTREQRGADGEVHWDMRKALMCPNGLDAALEHTVYAEPALIPASPWLSRARPAPPQLTVRFRGGSLEARWSARGREKVWLWVLQRRRAGYWTTEILPGRVTRRAWRGAAPEAIAVTAVDRYETAGPPTVLRRR